MDLKGWIASFAVGTALAAVTGGVAVYLRNDAQPAVLFLAFAIGTLPVWVGLASAFLVHNTRAPEHNEDSAEVQWLNRAASGAFFDLLLALGLSTAATSIADIDSVPTVVFVVLAMGDWALRYFLLQRREG